MRLALEISLASVLVGASTIALGACSPPRFSKTDGGAAAGRNESSDAATDVDADLMPPQEGELDSGMPPDASAAQPGSEIPTEPTSNVVGSVITTEPFSETAKALQLVSSHISSEPSGDGSYVKWYGVIVNRGDIPLCGVWADVDAFVGRSLRFETTGYATSSPYKTLEGGFVTVSCIPPGELGIASGNGFENGDLNPQAITKIHVKLEGRALGGYAHPAAPILDSIDRAAGDPEPGFGPLSYKLKGSLRAVAPIHNLRIDVFLMDENWFVFDGLVDLGDALARGETWQFETTTTDVREFHTLHPFIYFIEGFASAAPRLKSGLSCVVEEKVK